FGYFPAMKHPPVARFTHNFIVYEGHTLPKRYDGKLFAVAPLQGQVVCSDRLADRSSFQTKDVGFPITTTDPWFRPVDVKVGPDGAVYVADFYEGQIAHLRHHEGKIDRTNGRIYRLRSPTPPLRSRSTMPRSPRRNWLRYCVTKTSGIAGWLCNCSAIARIARPF